jgi:hypothetical protein
MGNIFGDIGGWIDDNIVKPIDNNIIKPIDDGAKDVIHIVVDGTVQTYNDATKVVNDAGNFVVDISKDTYNYSVAFAMDTAYRTADAGSYVARNTEDFSKAGLDVTQKEFINLSKQAETQIINGVEVIKYGFDYAYNWLDENACRIGLTAAISMGFVAAFSPSNPQGAAKSTSISAMVITAVESAGSAAKKTAVNTALAYAVALAIIEPIWAIPGVGGCCDKTLLTNCISNAIYYSFDVSMELWMSGAGVCIALGAAVAPIIATYICTRTMPNGFSKAITDPHSNANSLETLTQSIKSSEKCYNNLPVGWSSKAPKGVMYSSNMPPAGYKWVYGPKNEREKARIDC